MLFELIIKHLFISFGLFVYLVYYSIKGLTTYRARYKRWPIFLGYAVLLLASFYILVFFDPRPSSYEHRPTPALSSILIGIGILIATSIRFTLLVRDYKIKTAFYITAVNFSIVVFIFFIMVTYGLGQPERDRIKKEEEEKKKKEEEEEKKKKGYYR